MAGKSAKPGSVNPHAQERWGGCRQTTARHHDVSGESCWRLAEGHGFRKPHFRREWSREDIELILKMCESDRPVTEIAEYFDTTVKTIHQKIIKNGKKVVRNGSIYTVSLISSVLRVTRPIVRQWAGESRLELKSEVSPATVEPD